jgi:hypothetical protein
MRKAGTKGPGPLNKVPPDHVDMICLKFRGEVEFA